MRGVEVLAGLRKPLDDDKAREVLFGRRSTSVADVLRRVELGPIESRAAQTARSSTG